MWDALYFDRYFFNIPLPRNICFENVADIPLFCDEDLHFGVFLEKFPIRKMQSSL
jgi:hypothetical protein